MIVKDRERWGLYWRATVGQQEAVWTRIAKDGERWGL